MTSPTATYRIEMNGFGHVEVASYDLCARLHALTGWENTCYAWNTGRRRAWEKYYVKGTGRSRRTGDVEDFQEVEQFNGSVGEGTLEVATIPAYDLSYLLAKVPVGIPSGPGEFGMLQMETSGHMWRVGYSSGFNSPEGTAPTLVDAAAELCIAIAEKEAGRGR